jgi:hypothetical protein
MNIQMIITIFFILIICICIAKKQYIGSVITIVIGMVVSYLASNQSYWKIGGKTIIDGFISILNTILRGG